MADAGNRHHGVTMHSIVLAFGYLFFFFFERRYECIAARMAMAQ